LGNEVLLAYEMNGKPLEPIHGFPLRVIAPGYIGARSVKWLTQITVQPAPSKNYFQAHAYQLFSPQVNAETADWNAGLQLSELAVNCVITSPREGQSLAPFPSEGEGWGEVVVQGYALTGGGRKIARVDVSTDGGETWTTANITQGDQNWAWTFWETRMRVEIGDLSRAQSRECEIVARAFDSASNTQPEDARHVWNFKGYMNNAWHRVKVKVESDK
jgi:sulfite oxidase